MLLSTSQTAPGSRFRSSTGWSLEFPYASERGSLCLRPAPRGRIARHSHGPFPLDGMKSGTRRHQHRRPCTLRTSTASKKYRSIHRGPPSHVLFYDDGITHAFHFQSSAGQLFVVDEDQDRLLCYKPEFRSVGGSGCIIYHKNDEEVIKKTVPGGLVCTSFSAELREAICAVEQVLERPRPHAHYRWIVDCQGICASLARFEKQHNALIHTLRRLITTLTKDTGASLDVVWISSHCGLQ